MMFVSVMSRKSNITCFVRLYNIEIYFNESVFTHQEISTMRHSLPDRAAAAYRLSTCHLVCRSHDALHPRLLPPRRVTVPWPMTMASLCQMEAYSSLRREPLNYREAGDSIMPVMCRGSSTLCGR